MLLVGAAVAFFGYRYYLKSKAAPAAAEAAPVDELSGGGGGGGGYVDTSQSVAAPVAESSQVSPDATAKSIEAPATVTTLASDGIKGPVIPALVRYKGIVRPLVVNYTGTGIDPTIYTLNSGMIIGGFVNNSGTYTVITIPKNPYFVPGTLMVPISDLDVPQQV